MAMGSHQSTAMISDTWLTPPEIVKALGKFDLDPCCPPVMPWQTADRMLCARDDGLTANWSGRVWLNPPYSGEAVKWLRKLAAHGQGTALIFARTETSWFFETIWRAATSVLFLEGRIHFHKADGTRAAANAGAPSCLVAYGEVDDKILRECGIAGHYVRIATTQEPEPLSEPTMSMFASKADYEAAILASHRQAITTPLTSEEGKARGWYFDCDGHYIDVEKDVNGCYSVYFRDRADQSEAWLDQADAPHAIKPETKVPDPTPTR